MADSRFHALAAGDFNGDETSDLAVGAWANDVGGSNGQGSVTVYFGSSKGLKRSTHQFFTLETPGVPGSSVAPPRGSSGALFGWSLAAGDFGSSTEDDLAIRRRLRHRGHGLTTPERPERRPESFEGPHRRAFEAVRYETRC